MTKYDGLDGNDLMLLLKAKFDALGLALFATDEMRISAGDWWVKITCDEIVALFEAASAQGAYTGFWDGGKPIGQVLGDDK